jgi:hypothetical protein
METWDTEWLVELHKSLIVFSILIDFRSYIYIRDAESAVKKKKFLERPFAQMSRFGTLIYMLL